MLKIFEISKVLKTLNIPSLGHHLSASLDQCRRQVCYSQTISQATGYLQLLAQGVQYALHVIQHSG